MPLPKISQPVFNVVIPSSKKKISIRPMLVKEEKILLIARESGEDGDILKSIKQVVNNCIVDDGIDVEKMPIFDLEYLFIRIRSVSVSNISKVSYRDNEDEKIYDFEVDLDKVKVIFPEKTEKKISITDTAGIILKYPDASIYSDKNFVTKTESEIFEMLVINCIDKIYDGDEMYFPKDYKPEEMKEFLENLDLETYNKFREFSNNIPKIEYEIEYKNSLGNDKKIVLSSLNDFFTLG